MKSALFILIGYIICAYKVEINEGAAEEKLEDVKITPVVDTTGTGEPPDNNMQPEVDRTIITNPVDTSGVAEQSDSIMKPKLTILTPPVEPTNVEGQTDNIEQLQNVEKTKVTEKQEIQANDTGPTKIKVEDVLKILRKSKKKFASESIALMKKLQWLKSISNITEIEIEHKIDPNSFDYLSDTEINLSSSSIARRHGLNENPDFLVLKEAILKERGQSIKFKRFPRLA